MNNLRKTSILILGLVIFGLVYSCSNYQDAKQTDSNLNKKSVDDFTTFFARDCCGVTGADGIYSVLLPDGRTVWIFGDSFIGTVNADGSREKDSPIFIRNAMAVQDGDSLRTLYNEIDGWKTSLVVPEGAPKGKQFSEDSLWYWPGDGFIENGKLKVFMSAFYQADTGNWGFRWVRKDIAVLSLPDLKLEEVVIGPEPGKKKVHYGHAVCDDADDFTYIYGLGEGKVHVARVEKGDVTSTWKYYNGSSWVTDPNEAIPMLEFSGSEQFSVFKLKDKFVFLSQGGGFSRDVVSFVSDLPYTGWKDETILFKTTLPSDSENLFSYNALAHPQFIKDGNLLVSYCINSYELEDVFTDANNYRPRFNWVAVDKILKNK